MKKRILLIPIILIVITLVVTIIVLINKDNNTQKNIQTINWEDKSIDYASIDNGIEITGSKIECGTNTCAFNLIVKNPTTTNIDMSEYRISFRDSSNQEVYWFSGISIGNVKAISEQTVVLEIPSNLTNIVRIVYSK